MFKKIDLSRVVIVPREEYDRLKRAASERAMFLANSTDSMKYMREQQIAAAKRADATAPRVERPFVEQEPKAEPVVVRPTPETPRGTKVRFTDVFSKHFGVVGDIESHGSSLRQMDRCRVKIWETALQAGCVATEHYDELEVVESAPAVDPAPDAPKFKVGQRVRIIAPSWNAFKEGTIAKLTEDMNGGYISVNDSEGTGLPYNFVAEELEAIPDPPAVAPAPGAFLSIDEDRELVAMGREMCAEWDRQSDGCPAPRGTIMAIGHIKWSDEHLDCSAAFAPTPANPEHLTDAARAHLRRVRDERKQAANG